MQNQQRICINPFQFSMNTYRIFINSHKSSQHLDHQHQLNKSSKNATKSTWINNQHNKSTWTREINIKATWIWTNQIKINMNPHTINTNPRHINKTNMNQQTKLQTRIKSTLNQHRINMNQYKIDMNQHQIIVNQHSKTWHNQHIPTEISVTINTNQHGMF